MSDIQEGSDERELLKIQLLQVQEELELTFVACKWQKLRVRN